jgi:hypothetical protein
MAIAPVAAQSYTGNAWIALPAVPSERVGWLDAAIATKSISEFIANSNEEIACEVVRTRAAMDMASPSQPNPNRGSIATRRR